LKARRYFKRVSAFSLRYRLLLPRCYADVAVAMPPLIYAASRRCRLMLADSSMFRAAIASPLMLRAAMPP